MQKGKSDTLEKACKLMNAYAHRTGLKGNEGDIERRYLWTDAFAVQSYFGLAHALGDDNYRNMAISLIDAVHRTLGQYSRNDSRAGWISGLPDSKGQQHPTAGGLRIGKRLPEREPDEPFNEQLEWERDGQYFHYITRWVNALLQAKQETEQQQFADWAAELVNAGGKFIDRSRSSLRMYWKMSVDLTRPLVPSMGAHDPLEGLICAESALLAAPEKEQELLPLIKDFQNLCAGKDWATTDPLGIGGLLLNTQRAVELSSQTVLPEAVRPDKLLVESIYGLKAYCQTYAPNRTANHRLAFRECGLSLGLRAMAGMAEELAEKGLHVREQLANFIPLADSIEEFWTNPENQQASTWTEHLDINAVSLASSLVAQHYPRVFC